MFPTSHTPAAVPPKLKYPIHRSGPLLLVLWQRHQTTRHPTKERPKTSHQLNPCQRNFGYAIPRFNRGSANFGRNVISRVTPCQRNVDGHAVQVADQSPPKETSRGVPSQALVRSIQVGVVYTEHASVTPEDVGGQEIDIGATTCMISSPLSSSSTSCSSSLVPPAALVWSIQVGVVHTEHASEKPEDVGGQEIGIGNAVTANCPHQVEAQIRTIWVVFSKANRTRNIMISNRI